MRELSGMGLAPLLLSWPRSRDTAMGEVWNIYARTGDAWAEL